MSTDMSSTERIAANVRFWLGHNNLSQADAARALGISSGVMSTRCNGDSRFQVEELEPLARFLEVPVAHLLSQDGPHGPAPKTLADGDWEVLVKVPPEDAPAGDNVTAALANLQRDMMQTADALAKVMVRLTSHATTLERLVHSADAE